MVRKQRNTLRYDAVEVENRLYGFLGKFYDAIVPLLAAVTVCEHTLFTVHIMQLIRINVKFEGNREVKRTMITVFDEVGAFVWMVVLQLLRIAEKMRYRASRWVLAYPIEGEMAVKLIRITI